MTRLWHKIWNRNPIHRCVLYRALADAPRDTPSQLSDLTIRRWQRSQDLPDSIQRALLNYGGAAMRTELDQLFGAGSTLWTGEIEGSFAGVCWHSQPRDRSDYFVPMTSTEAAIYACLVLPEFRGRSIYTRMLRHITGCLFNDGLTAVYIDCKRWNRPSIRGIEKAGFEFVGESWRFVSGGKARYFWNGCGQGVEATRSSKPS